MGLHSMAGYAGGFVGPLVVGSVLDLMGHDTAAGWGLGFGHLAIVTLAALILLKVLTRPIEQGQQIPKAAIRTNGSR